MAILKDQINVSDMTMRLYTCHISFVLMSILRTYTQMYNVEVRIELYSSYNTVYLVFLKI